MAKKVNTLKVDGTELPISNPDKIMYPGNGFNKAQVIDYYIRISPVLLPHLKDRPLTLKRYPDGVEGDHFFEKNAPRYTPDWIKTAPVLRKGGEGKINYILINDLPSLIWTVNLANLEMHCFLSRAPKIERPTSM